MIFCGREAIASTGRIRSCANGMVSEKTMTALIEACPGIWPDRLYLHMNVADRGAILVDQRPAVHASPGKDQHSKPLSQIFEQSLQENEPLKASMLSF